ncbi:copper chaperone CopZ [Trueperella bonasi]|uniref:Copper chaperone CopZ n=1 Tax=Trueperella bonasi TaxID=312286 RepID=A0ABT9NGF5_9ACTO|nr:heavy metal-associated domain-containing protein [Trueperella bonasi]MDP9806483.1 copper chaperone CopZ [Trueperella bonasi]
MAHIQLRIDGMTCDNCVAHVSEELTELDGVADVLITLNTSGTSEVQVVTDGEVTDEQLREAVDEAGEYHIVDIVR